MINLRDSKDNRYWSFVEIVLAVLAFMFFPTTVRSQVCPASGIQAGVDFDVNVASDSTSTGHYLLIGKGTVNCKGTVQAWIFHTFTSCSSITTNIDFEVWRPKSGNSYELVGVNSYSEDCLQMRNTTSVTFGIGPVNQIPVEPGYVIGWNQPLGALEISYVPVADKNSVFANFSTAVGVGLGGSDQATNSSSLLDHSLKVVINQGSYPTLDNLPAQVNISENNPIPSPVIFKVDASHICNINYPLAVPLTFSWSPTQPFFSSNSSKTRNGELDVIANETLDYETQKVYRLSITVTGLGLSTTEILTINVIDQNEPHSIVNLPTTIVVPAPSTPAGREVFLVLISDRDTNPPVPVRFYLSGWTSPSTASDIPPFTVDPNTGSVKSVQDLKDWFLTNPTASPYPSSVTYYLTILATDGLHSNSSVLTITITQIKQPPKILNLPNTTTIKDNTPINSIVFQVVVSPTLDKNLSFLMTPPIPDFCLDQLSGVITVCSYAKLNACQKPSYSINVTVKNSALRTSAILTILVQRVIIAPTFSQPSYSGSIDEECPSNSGGSCSTPVNAVNISVQNNNCPPNSTCSMLAGSGSQFFSSSCTAVYNTKPIDVDVNPQFETITLLIEAQDSGLTTHATVTVSVININDNAPIFSPAVYNASVHENAQGGTSVATVKASDLDRERNGIFSYGILTSDPSFLYFQVDPQSGLITTKQPLDFESTLSYTVTVWAIDEGTRPGPRNDSAVVYITIVNENDNRPDIDCSNRPSDEPYRPPQPCFYNYDLNYDAIVGSNVSDLLMTASDIDPSSSSKVEFHLLLAEPHFDFNETNGLTTVAAPVEAYKKYVLYVYAEDNGSPSLRSRITYARIDTYRPDKHWIDLTVRPETSGFDPNDFLYALRNVTWPWFAKIVSLTTYEPYVQKDVIVTVYALADTSTYLPENIADQKVFVPRDDLLEKFRKNIYGDPKDIVQDQPFEGVFPVIKVMPTYVNWWLDTVEGIATITCLSVIPVVIAVVVLIAILKARKLLCFKQSSSGNAMKPKNTDSLSPGQSQNSNESVRYRSSHGRRASVLTVHSDIGLS